MIKNQGSIWGMSRSPERPAIPMPVPARQQPLAPQIHAPQPAPPPPADAERTLDAPGASTELA